MDGELPRRIDLDVHVVLLNYGHTFRLVTMATDQWELSSAAKDWAAEECFDLYVQYGDDTNIRHNVYCNHALTNFDFTLGGVDIEIKQNRDLQSGLGVTGAAVWDGSIVLARYIELYAQELCFSPSASRCLELGAGTGLLGIALNVCLGARHMWVTDKDEMLKLLTQNVERNQSSAHVGELVWGESLPDDICEQQFDFVLAADCIYHENLVPRFVQALVDCSARAHATVLISFELRDSEVIECFLAHAYMHFDLERLDKSGKYAAQYGNMADGVAIYRLSLLR